MVVSSDRIVDALRASLTENERLRRENDQLKEAESEPVAIVGMGCRFPGGVSSPAHLWKLVDDGVDAIGDLPDGRGWKERVLELWAGSGQPVPQGGFVEDADRFDAGVFGISPHEALAMDPQQRLLLEGAWEVFERSGIVPGTLKGSRTGVFIGAAGSGYGTAVTSLPEGVGTHIVSGSATSVISGRLAYVFGLEGPAVTVDTACSSSLVALHLAVQSLRQGECSLALAGGVTVMSTAGTYYGFRGHGVMAADGRCKSFAAAADGTSWAEGVGLLLLERLSDARRHGHPVLSVVRGSAVNQDGASNGLTAPNGPSQQRVIRYALTNARLAPEEVDVLEAHGTGTVLGDPIEVQALQATYGRNRPPDRPLLLGSIKSNIGHTQAASGVAGVIKMVMALLHARVPQTLHVDTPSLHIAWSASAVELVTQSREWPRTGRPRRAAVSSFGISGTNAHIILEQAPEEVPKASPGAAPTDQQAVLREPGPLPLLLSGASPAALGAQGGRLLGVVGSDAPSSLEALAVALATRRARFEHRAVVLADGSDSARDGLRALAEDRDSPVVIRGNVGGSVRKVAFVFPGQGSQWHGMAVELLDRSPIFSAYMAECDRALTPWVDWRLTDVLRSRDAAAVMDRVDIVQPLLWAVMVALAQWWRAHGLEPSAVVGHSQGEIAAACVAGGLSLNDGAKFVALRSRIIAEELSGRGAMASIALPPDRVRDRLDRDAVPISLAARNGPHSTVVSGGLAAVAAFVESCAEEGIHTRIIAVDYASHSDQVAPLRDRLIEATAGIVARPSTVPFVSTVTGGWLDTALLDGQYWYRNLRQTVRFDDAVRTLLDHGVGLTLECSPHPVLVAGVEESIEAVGSAAVALGTLRRNDGGIARFRTSLAQAFVHGAPIDAGTLFAGCVSEPVDLPTYPFERTRYWLEDTTAPRPDASGLGLRPAEHPLLGAAVELADRDELVLTGRVGVDTSAWWSGYTVLELPTVPAAALIEMAVHAADQVDAGAVGDLVFHAPLILPPTGSITLQLRLGPPDDAGMRSLAVHSQLPEGRWAHHATARVLPHQAATTVDALTSWPPAGATVVDDTEGHRVWRFGQEIFAEVTVADGDRDEVEHYTVHPALLGAAFAAWWSAQPQPLQPGHAWVLSSVGLTVVHAEGAVAARVRMSPSADGGVAVVLADAEGALVAELHALRFHTVSASEPVEDSAGYREEIGSAMHRVVWEQLATPEEVRSQRWAVLGDGELADALRASGVDIVTAPDLSAAAAVFPVPDVVALPVDPPAEIATGAAGAAQVVAGEVLGAVQEFLAHDHLHASRLVVLTRGAVDLPLPPETAAASDDLGGAAVWGLVASAQSEHPGRFVLVDMPEGPGNRDADAALVQRAVATGEPRVAVRDHVLRAPRLARADGFVPDESAAAFDPQATVLVTGGTGTLGALVARHLVVRYGVRHLLLASRRGLQAPEATGLVTELGRLGATVTIATCNVGDRAQLAGVISAIPVDHPLTAVVHAAGVLDDGTVESLSPERLERVFKPKVDAAIHLDELTRGIELAAFVLFSSAAGVLGSPGQGNYAAANAALDGLAARRRRAGMPAISLAWGLWEERSELTKVVDETGRGRVASAAFPSLSTSEGLALFDAALRSKESHVVLFPLDVQALQADLDGSVVPPLFRGLITSPRRRMATSVSAAALGQRLAAAPVTERTRTLLELVRSQAAAVLGHESTTAVSVGRPFHELGFDSLTTIDLRNRLAAATGLRLPVGVIYDHPTPSALAAHLCTHLGLDVAQRSASARGRRAEHDEANRERNDPVVIVGMSCRLPGRIDSPERLWEFLLEEGDAVAGLPEDRGWDIGRYPELQSMLPGFGLLRNGGFIRQASGFDAEFFGIDPEEALVMDPQQRLLLEMAWEALERTGTDPLTMRGTSVGVFIGTFFQNYVSDLRQVPEASIPYLSTAGGAPFASARVAYTLALEGPTLTIDTGCSSSGVALHVATRAVRSGECTAALVGGITVMAFPAAFADLGGAAPDGRCKSFSASADGTGWGDGAGMLVIERLSEARRRGHPVLAVVRGSAMNHNGASNGLSAPNGRSQQQVIRWALADAGLTPADVEVVEAHGTGTPLGDAIEAEALIATYGRERPVDAPLRLGTVKSNLGHPHAASGVVGVIKAVLSIQHGFLPRTLHVDDPLPEVDWSAGGVALLSEPSAWPDLGRPRRVGVSSFGASGTKVHLVLEQAPDPLNSAEVSGSRASMSTSLACPVAAKSDRALAAQARRLFERLRDDTRAAPVDVGFSLGCSRSTFARRAVVVAADRAELLAGLDALSREERHPNVVRTVVGCEGDDRVMILFPDHDEQDPERAAELYRAHPPYTAAWDAVAAAAGSHLREPLPAPGSCPARTPLADRFEVVGAFADGVARYRLLEHWGVLPDVLAGDGIGEVAAAHAAGSLALQDAVAEAVRRAPDDLRVTTQAGPTPRVETGRLPAVCFGTGQPVDPLSWSEERVEASPSGKRGAALTDHVGLVISLGPRIDADLPVLVMMLGAEPAARSVAHAYTQGAKIDWAVYFAGSGARRIDLPTYAFQRQHYWLGASSDASRNEEALCSTNHVARTSSPSTTAGLTAET